MQGWPRCSQHFAICCDSARDGRQPQGVDGSGLSHHSTAHPSTETKANNALVQEEKGKIKVMFKAKEGSVEEGGQWRCGDKRDEALCSMESQE